MRSKFAIPLRQKNEQGTSKFGSPTSPETSFHLSSHNGLLSINLTVVSIKFCTIDGLLGEEYLYLAL